MATVFAHNAKAYGAWRRRIDRQSGHSAALTGAALEAQILGLAQTNPEYVVMGA